MSHAPNFPYATHLNILHKALEVVDVQALADALPADFPKHLRTVRRDLEALEAAGFPLLTERVDGRWVCRVKRTRRLQ